MGNHVIRDRIWKSRKLARCSRGAALAYPWIFLVSDEWGRFEFRPHAIWSEVFGPRQDYAPLDTPTVADVTGWLAEYETTGLLVRYHIDGDLAYWTGFHGREKGKRKPSDYPAPDAASEVGALSGPQEKPGGAPSKSKSKSGRQEQEQELEPAARAAVDAYNATFGTRITLTPGNLRAAVRAFEAGYSLEQMATVFQAVRVHSTATARWCAEHNREFEYLIRPPYKHTRTQEIVNGPLDKILNEIATGRKVG